MKKIIIGVICTLSLGLFAASPAGTQRLVLKIEGMTCGHCAERVKKQLSQVCSNADVSLENKKAVCDYKAPVTEKEIISEAEKTGFTITPVK